LIYEFQAQVQTEIFSSDFKIRISHREASNFASRGNFAVYFQNDLIVTIKAFSFASRGNFALHFQKKIASI
jgi:hypothetical protein